MNLLELALKFQHAEHVIKDSQADLAFAADVVHKAATGFIGNPNNPLDWPALAASTVEKKGNNLMLLETGEMKASIEKTVARDWAEVGSNNDKAVYHEFGTAKIPPRPFFAPAAVEGAGAMILRYQQRVARAFEGGSHGGGHGDFLHNLHHATHAIKEAVELFKGLVE